MGLSDLSNQVFQFDGFTQIIKGTGLDPFHPIVGCCISRQEYHFRLGIQLLDPAKDLDAVHPRHFYIQHHDFRGVFFEQIQAFFTTSRFFG